MNFIRTTVHLLKVQKRFGFVLLSLIVSLGCVIAFCLDPDAVYLYFTFLLLTTTIWDISDAYKDSVILCLKGKVADLADELCVARHAVDRLNLELDTYKEAVKKVEEKAGSSTEGTSTADAQRTELRSLRPKRRPAPKRKPKTNETKDENQN